MPTDFSKESKEAIKYAATVARRLHVPLTLLHVVEPATFTADFGYGAVIRSRPDKDRVCRASARLKNWLRFLAVPAGTSVAVLSGKPCSEITQAARALKSNLIIMACSPDNHKTETRENVAEKVMRQAHCPVFIFRTKACTGQKQKSASRFDTPAAISSPD